MGQDKAGQEHCSRSQDRYSCSLWKSWKTEPEKDRQNRAISAVKDFLRVFPGGPVVKEPPARGGDPGPTSGTEDSRATEQRGLSSTAPEPARLEP